MTLAWKPSPRRTWNTDETLHAGKIGVACIFKNIGSRGEKDTFRLVFKLPQVKEDDSMNRFEESHIPAMKKHAEEVVTKWFKATEVTP